MIIRIFNHQNVSVIGIKAEPSTIDVVIKLVSIKRANLQDLQKVGY